MPPSSGKKMKVTGSSETSVNISNIIQRINPEYRHPNLHCRENPKSQVNSDSEVARGPVQ